MTIRELYDALEARIPPSLSCPWDNDGLAVCPDPDAPVRGVLIALDPTEDAVEHAIAMGCNVLITHHPLLFHGIKAVDGEDTASRKVIRLISSGVSAMSFHTRLDAAEGGVNDTLAALLGLEDCTPFGTDDNPAKAPLGRVGNLPEAMPLEAFIDNVKTALDVPAVQYADAGRPVHRVAVLGGAGEDDIAAAIAAGADTYVTGEARHHFLCDAPYMGINLVAAGHHHTECFPVCARLAALVGELCYTPVYTMNNTRLGIR